MELELDPPQPPEVLRTLGVLLAASGKPPDPWWQAGLDDALEAFDADPR
jgi:hypothetical protein